MAINTIYTLEESNITISGGEPLSGVTQWNGSHLLGQTITLSRIGGGALIAMGVAAVAFKRTPA